jgi:hypothetical protein
MFELFFVLVLLLFNFLMGLKLVFIFYAWVHV